MTAHWTTRHIGLPWAERGRSRQGCDCYGLARIIYQEELGISLPDYLGYASTEELGEIAALIDGAKQLPMWLPVTGPAVAFDLAVFRRGRLSTHIGVVVRRGLMIHMADEDCAKIEDYAGGRWSYRLTGHFRHVDVIGRAQA